MKRFAAFLFVVIMAVGAAGCVVDTGKADARNVVNTFWQELKQDDAVGLATVFSDLVTVDYGSPVTETASQAAQDLVDTFDLSSISPVFTITSVTMQDSMAVISANYRTTDPSSGLTGGFDFVFHVVQTAAGWKINYVSFELVINM